MTHRKMLCAVLLCALLATGTQARPLVKRASGDALIKAALAAKAAAGLQAGAAQFEAIAQAAAARAAARAAGTTADNAVKGGLQSVGDVAKTAASPKLTTLALSKVDVKDAAAAAAAKVGSEETAKAAKTTLTVPKSVKTTSGLDSPKAIVPVSPKTSAPGSPKAFADGDAERLAAEKASKEAQKAKDLALKKKERNVNVAVGALAGASVVGGTALTVVGARKGN